MFLNESEKENHVCTCGSCTCGESVGETGEVGDGVNVSSEAGGDEVKSGVSVDSDNVMEKGYYIFDEVCCHSQETSLYDGSFSGCDSSFSMNYLDLNHLVSYLDGIFREVNLPSLHLVGYGSRSDLSVGLGFKSGRFGVFVEVRFTDDFMDNKDVNMHAFVCALNSCVHRSNGLIRRVIFDSRMGGLSDIDNKSYPSTTRSLLRKINVSLDETYVLFFEFGTSVGVTCVGGYNHGLLELGVYKRDGSLRVIDPLGCFFDIDSCKDGFLLGVGLHTLKESGFRVLLSHFSIVKGSLVEL